MIYDPYRTIKLIGHWTIRVANLVLPTRHVQAMLPWGLELGPQNLTEPGTHLVRAYFGFPVHATMTFPPRIMTMDYCEQVLGVPYCVRTTSLYRGGARGPFYYMPRLWLNNAMAISGGLMWWGMEKRPALIEPTVEDARGSYRVSKLGRGAERIIEATWDVTGEYQPAAEVANFAPHREMMDQPLVMQGFASLGPLLVGSSFTMTWGAAKVRPITATVQVHESYVPGLPVGKFQSVGLDESPLGSFELDTPWELALPYSVEAADMVAWMQSMMGGAFSSSTTGL